MPPAVEVNIKPKQINKYEFKFLIFTARVQNF